MRMIIPHARYFFHGMAKRWIQKVREQMEKRGTVGAFRRAAQRAGMDTCSYAEKVLRDPNAPTKLKRRAAFAKATGCRHRAKRRTS
jgi:hypothetical protein